MVGTWSTEIKLFPDFCFLISGGGPRSHGLKWLLVLWPSNYLPGGTMKWGKKKGRHLPFNKTVQKSHIAHNFCLHFIGKKLDDMAAHSCKGHREILKLCAQPKIIVQLILKRRKVDVWEVTLSLLLRTNP